MGSSNLRYEPQINPIRMDVRVRPEKPLSESLCVTCVQPGLILVHPRTGFQVDLSIQWMIPVTWQLPFLFGNAI